MLGPSTNELMSRFDDALFGKSISAYPLMATLDNSGKVVIDPTTRQGDPICDQFVVRRQVEVTAPANLEGMEIGPCLP